MTNTKRNALSEEERKFLYLCLKSKNKYELKKIILKEKIINKLTGSFITRFYR